MLAFYFSLTKALNSFDITPNHLVASNNSSQEAKPCSVLLRFLVSCFTFTFKLKSFTDKLDRLDKCIKELDSCLEQEIHRCTTKCLQLFSGIINVLCPPWNSSLLLFNLHLHLTLDFLTHNNTKSAPRRILHKLVYFWVQIGQYKLLI